MNKLSPASGARDEANEARLQRLTQTYSALNEINQAIIRMSDEAELLPLVCRIAVNHGGARMAWIGQAAANGTEIISLQSFGTGTDYLEHIRIPFRGDAEDGQGQGPTVTALLENRVVVVNHFVLDPMTVPWHDTARLYGWGSGGFFPIRRGGERFAVLGVYHEVDDFFDPTTIELLKTLARDIEFALDNFDRESQRRQALAALQASEQHFRAYFERSMLGMAATLPDRTWMEVNQALCDMLGYSVEELKTLDWKALTHPDDLAANNHLFEQLLSRELDESVLEKRFIHKSGRIVYVHLAVRAVRDNDEQLAYIVSLVEDITPRKLAERREAIRRKTLEQVARGAALQDIMLQVVHAVEELHPDSHCSIMLTDSQGEKLYSVIASSLPSSFSEAINGAPVEVGIGSCGTAASTGQRVVVEDIASHPHWADYKHLALEAGLASCWSQPICLVDGEVVGTFGIYRSYPSVPDPHEIELIESAANLVGIAFSNQRAQKQLHLASSIYLNSAEAVLVTDPANHIVAINPAFTKITGYTLDELLGKDPSMLSSGRHDKAFFRQLWLELNQKDLWQGEIWNRRKDGELFPEWITINTIRSEQGEIQHYVALGSDITNKVRSDELIWHQANYDFLTDLPNRYMFQDRLEQEIRKAQRQRRLLALLFIDLDRFKDVNDSLGHPVGDLLLTEAARRIAGCIRESDTVARMGGDEFTVILPQLEQALDAEAVAQQIISALAEPFTINDKAIYISASIGITFYPDDAQDVDLLLSNADQAMYAAKSAGRNRLHYFTRSLHDRAQQRLKLISDLRGAVSSEQLALYFQPIIDLASGRVSKAEALLRWHHPSQGMISPAEFIPLAEETGLIIDIGDWVFRETARHLRRWRDLYPGGLQVSINISPAQFQNEALNINEWLSYLGELEVMPQNLSIEITEGLLLNARKDITDKLLLFRDAGIQVAIDDFGTGYSALSYLKRFDIDYLKIDQSFIRNLENEQNDRVLSEAIVIMAHKLGLKVIAEGVETEAQRQLLADIGCDSAQGYLFSPPVPVDEFERYLDMRGELPLV